MKIFLIGGFGFIGKRLIQNLYKTHELIVFSKESTNKFINQNDFPSIIIEKGNIQDLKIYESIKYHNPDVVIHFAALTGLKKCQDNPSNAFTTNVFGTYNVAKACLETKSKLIFCSSREVYGESLNGESKEDDLPCPNNVYGITKLLGETILKHISQNTDFDYTILRLSNVFGPGNLGEGVNKIIKNAVKEKKITINGGKQLMNLVFVDDVVNFLNLVLNNKKSSKEIFNVGSLDNITIQSFSEKVKSLINELTFEYVEQPKTETKFFKPNMEKSKRILGFVPKTNLIEGIKKTIDWYSEN